MIKSMEDVRELKRNLEAQGLRIPSEWGQVENIRFLTHLVLKLGNKIEELKESGATPIVLQSQVEQLQVQLAGCATAAQGATNEPAKPGDYGWSQSYQDVLDLRLKYDEFLKMRPVTSIDFLDSEAKKQGFVLMPAEVPFEFLKTELDKLGYYPMPKRGKKQESGE